MIKLCYQILLIPEKKPTPILIFVQQRQRLRRATDEVKTEKPREVLLRAFKTITSKVVNYLQQQYALSKLILFMICHYMTMKDWKIKL